MKTTVSRAPLESTVASAKLKIASLLPSVGITSVLRIERDAETPPTPTPTIASRSSGRSDRGGIAHPVAQPVDERLPNQRVGRLARIARAEVDHAHASGLDQRPSLGQADERIRRLPLEDGGEGHG